MVKLESMCIILEKTKIQLEAAADIGRMTTILREANSLTEEISRNRDFLEDYLLEKQEFDAQNKEVNSLINEIAVGSVEDQDEVEKMYDDLCKETLDEQIGDINLEKAKRDDTRQQKIRMEELQNRGKYSINKISQHEGDDSIEQLLQLAAGGEF